MYISAMEVRVLYRSLVTMCHASYIVRTVIKEVLYVCCTLNVQ